MGCGRTPRWRQVSYMAKISPFKFLQEVRAEAQKVTWPSRRETAVTTAMVFVMVAVASIFFLVADHLMRMVVTLVLAIGGVRNRWNDGEALVHRPGLFEFRAQGRRFDPRAGQAAPPRSPVRRGHGTDRKGRGGAPRTKSRRRAQILPRLRAGEDGPHRRGLPPDQEHAEGHGISRRRQQAQADF